MSTPSKYVVDAAMRMANNDQATFDDMLSVLSWFLDAKITKRLTQKAAKEAIARAGINDQAQREK